MQDSCTQNKIDWSEFLKNEQGKESADRLLLLLSFIPATIITAKICTVEALGVYLGSYGLVMANAKWAGRNVNNTSMAEDTDSSADTDNAPNNSVSKRKSRVRS